MKEIVFFKTDYWKFSFIWYDMWIGLYIDQTNCKLYFAFLGFVLSYRCWKIYMKIDKFIWNLKQFWKISKRNVELRLELFRFRFRNRILHIRVILLKTRLKLKRNCYDKIN